MKYALDNQLTVWGARTSMVQTARGSVSYIDWCHAEVARMARHGRAAEVVERERDGAVCVARKAVAA